MIHIFFLIRSLNVGGAERQLVELVKGLDKTRFNITVGLFYNEGPLIKELEKLGGVNFISLNKSGRWDLLRFSFKLYSLLRKLKPDIICPYLIDANLAGLITGRLAGIHKVVWGLRASNMDVKHYHWLFALSLKIGAWLSRFPDALIFNSYAGMEFHNSIGYSNNRMVVIPNGIDLERYVPDPEVGKKVRSGWGVKEKNILIGLIGRMDPMKDYPTFLKAASILAKEREDVSFVCVGDGPVDYRQYLISFGEELGLSTRLIWAGLRNDMQSVCNALDIASSSSAYGEGFPNVIGEAMACGIPCVVTNVGDSAEIVGDTGVVVPTKNPQALADGWHTMIHRLHNNTMPFQEMARNRIVSLFSSEMLVRKTSDFLLSL